MHCIGADEKQMRIDHAREDVAEVEARIEYLERRKKELSEAVDKARSDLLTCQIDLAQAAFDAYFCKSTLEKLEATHASA